MSEPDAKGDTTGRGASDARSESGEPAVFEGFRLSEPEETDSEEFELSDYADELEQGYSRGFRKRERERPVPGRLPSRASTQRRRWGRSGGDQRSVENYWDADLGTDDAGEVEAPDNREASPVGEVEDSESFGRGEMPGEVVAPQAPTIAPALAPPVVSADDDDLFSAVTEDSDDTDDESGPDPESKRGKRRRKRSREPKVKKPKRRDTKRKARPNNSSAVAGSADDPPDDIEADEKPAKRKNRKAKKDTTPKSPRTKKARSKKTPRFKLRTQKPETDADTDHGDPSEEDTPTGGFLSRLPFIRTKRSDDDSPQESRLVIRLHGSKKDFTGMVLVVDGLSHTRIQITDGLPETAETIEHSTREEAEEALTESAKKLPRGTVIVWCSKHAITYRHEQAVLERSPDLFGEQALIAHDLTEHSIDSCMGTRVDGVLAGLSEDDYDLLRLLSKRHKIYTSLVAGDTQGYWLRVGFDGSELIAVNADGEVAEIAVLPTGTGAAARRLSRGEMSDVVISDVSHQLTSAVQDECTSWRSRTPIKGRFFVHGPGEGWSGLRESLQGTLGYVVAPVPGSEGLDEHFGSGRRGQLTTAALATARRPLLWPKDVTRKHLTRNRRIAGAWLIAVLAVSTVILGWSWNVGRVRGNETAALEAAESRLSAQLDPEIDSKLNRYDQLEVIIEALLTPDPIVWGEEPAWVAAAEHKFCDRTEQNTEGMLVSPYDEDGCLIAGTVQDVFRFEERRCQPYELTLHYDVNLPSSIPIPQNAVTPSLLVLAAKEIATAIYGNESFEPEITASGGWQLSTSTDGDWLSKQFVISPNPEARNVLCDPLEGVISE